MRFRESSVSIATAVMHDEFGPFSLITARCRCGWFRQTSAEFGKGYATTAEMHEAAAEHETACKVVR